MTLTHSEQINEIAAALAKAQGEIENAKKDSANPFFKSNYADLAAVRDATHGALAKHGLALVQSPFTDGARVSVETLLMHTSGQWLRGVVTSTAKDEGPQAIGSCITYLRRYALQSFTGVAAEDDDGNAAEARGKASLNAQIQKVAEPTGFDHWLHDLSAVAAEGTAALQATWKASKPEFRAYLNEHYNEKWMALKATAVKVKPAEPVSA